MNLFIVGNGFDVSHKLATKYGDFQKYLKDSYPKSLNIEPSIDISPSMLPDGEEIFDDNELVAFLIDIISKVEKGEDEWNDLENTLGNLNYDEYFEEVSNLYDEDNEKFNLFHRAYHYEDISTNFKEATIEIKRLFSEWVNTIDISNVKRKPAFENILDKSNDYFITFNYTTVLETIYEANNVFHLHGKQEDEIIFGHGVFKEDFENLYTGTEFALAEIHNALRKDTDKVIREWSKMFSSLGNVKNIYSYGFSFSEVDLPYILEICNNIDTYNTTWYLNSYDKEKNNQFKKCIKECGFKGDFLEYTV